ncbi:hypothetical protein D9M68_649470 [compost metagenome]
MAGHAEDKYQHAGGGHHVPEVGLVAQGDEDEQVVQQQRQNHPVDQAEADVLVACVLFEVVELPDFQREGIAGGVQAAEVQDQRLAVEFRQLEQHAPVRMVAAFRVRHGIAGVTGDPAALAVGQVELQVEDGDAGVFQPPLAGCLWRALQGDLDPPGITALADGGAPGGWLEAALHGRIGHVGDAQLTADVFQQLDLLIQRETAAFIRQQYRRGVGRAAHAGQAQ